MPRVPFSVHAEMLLYAKLNLSSRISMLIATIIILCDEIMFINMLETCTGNATLDDEKYIVSLKNKKKKDDNCFLNLLILFSDVF